MIEGNENYNGTTLKSPLLKVDIHMNRFTR